jgi:hypothetical protein
MSTSHHGSDNIEPNKQHVKELIDRFTSQVEGRAKRAYEQGRIKADDDGKLVYAVAADKEHARVIIDFGKGVTWIGFTADDAVKLAELLIAKAREIATEPLAVSIG